MGALANAVLFDKLGVLLFMLLLVLGRPLADVAYFTIQMLVIDTVSAIEHRNKYSYIFSQEFGFYIGRFSGCGLFILLANAVSTSSPCAALAGDRAAATAFGARGAYHPPRARPAFVAVGRGGKKEEGDILLSAG